MKNLFLRIALVLAVTLPAFAHNTQAQTVWDGSSDISWYSGTQTQYDISTPEQLAGVARLVNDHTTTFSGVTLNLTADIWLNADHDSTHNWTPIGGYATATQEAQNSTSAYAFSGTFNGNGHFIHNLYCDKSNYYQAGLFGCVRYPCNISDLGLVNPVVKALGMAGALIGYTHDNGHVYVSRCMLMNVRVEGTGYNNLGGVVGGNYKMQGSNHWLYVTDCSVTGSISGRYVGGIGGNGQRVRVLNSYFAGTLHPVPEGNTLQYGGILGHCSNSTLSLTNAYSNVPAPTTYGYGRDGIIVTDAYMKTAAFVSDLGETFVADTGMNGGYPVLEWTGLGDISILADSLPYFTDFTSDSHWWLNNGGAVNQWMIGAADGVGESALFISNDLESAGYDIAVASTVMAEKPLVMPNSDSVWVVFDVMMGGETHFDYLKVFLVPMDVTFHAGRYNNTQSPAQYADYAMDFTAFKPTDDGYPYLFNMTGGVAHVAMNMANPEPGWIAKLVFLWRNDNTTGTQPGAVITRLGVYESDPCPAPEDVQLADLANESFTVEWAADPTVESWNIRYRAQDSLWHSATASTNAYTVAGLEGSTVYELQVQANCGNGNVSGWSPLFTVQTTNVGVEDRLAAHVSLYPNPAKEVVNVQCTMNNVQCLGVEVFDVYGKIVRTDVGANNDSPLQTRINVAGLAEGVYFVRVTTENGVVTKSFVKR